MSSPQHVSDEQIAQFNELLLHDPQYLQLVEAARRPATSSADLFRSAEGDALNRYLSSKGIDTHAMKLNIGRDGTMSRDHDTRNQLLATGAIMGGGYALSALPAVAGSSSALGPQLGGAASGAGTFGAPAGAAYGGGAAAATGSAAGTAGAITKAGALASRAAPILGNMAQSGEAANARRDQLAPSMENAQLNRDRFALSAPAQRLDQASTASILSNYTPRKINWGGPGSGVRGEIPTYSGGYQGGMENLDPRVKQMADDQLSQYLQGQLAHADGNASHLNQAGHESAGDKAIGTASTLASLYAAWKGLK